MSGQLGPTERHARLAELVEGYSLNDRQIDELAALHREMVAQGDLPAELRYVVDVEPLYDDSGELSHHAFTVFEERTRADEVELWQVGTRTVSEWHAAAVLYRHGVGREVEGSEFVHRLIGEAGLYDGREFTTDEIARAADSAERDRMAAHTGRTPPLQPSQDAEAEAER